MEARRYWAGASPALVARSSQCAASVRSWALLALRVTKRNRVLRARIAASGGLAQGERTERFWRKGKLGRHRLCGGHRLGRRAEHRILDAHRDAGRKGSHPLRREGGGLWPRG